MSENPMMLGITETLDFFDLFFKRGKAKIFRSKVDEAVEDLCGLEHAFGGHETIGHHYALHSGGLGRLDAVGSVLENKTLFRIDAGDGVFIFREKARAQLEDIGGRFSAI